MRSAMCPAHRVRAASWRVRRQTNVNNGVAGNNSAVTFNAVHTLDLELNFGGALGAKYRHEAGKLLQAQFAAPVNVIGLQPTT